MCFNGIVYAAEVDGRRLNFGVTGMLWQDSLVMYDAETDSLWSHILGQAMSGPLKDKRLEPLPSVVTEWASWRKSHPDGTIVQMSRTADRYTSVFYKMVDRFVFGIADDKYAKSWRFATMADDPVIEDTWQGQPVVLFFDRYSSTPRLFQRRLGGRVLSFQVQPGRGDGSDEGGADVFQDVQTHSTWNPVSGFAVAGKLEGERLVPLNGIVSFARAWQTFHPESADQ